MPTAKNVLPTTVMDNSLVTATRELGDQVRILRWRPGLGAIHEVEENSFYVGLNLKGKDFRGIDELNQYMKRLTAGGRPVPRIPPETPSEKAQALVYGTIGAQRKKRIERCQQALAIYPGCADAWVILSEYEKDTDARREMLEQAVKAGEICLRDAGIDTDDSGRPVRSKRRSGSGGESEESLWGGSARPYMRARLALAQHLYQMGERDRAIKDYRDLLELNSHDNQGVRYLLVSACLNWALTQPPTKPRRWSRGSPTPPRCGPGRRCSRSTRRVGARVVRPSRRWSRGRTMRTLMSSEF